MKISKFIIIFSLLIFVLNAYSQNYWPRDQLVPHATAIRMNNSGFDYVEEEIAAYITPELFEDMIENPVYEGNGVEVNIYNIDFTTPPSVNIFATTDGINVGISINNLVVDGEISLLGICDCDMTVTSNPLNISTTAVVNVVNDQYNVELHNTNVNFQNFNLSVDCPWYCEIAGWLIELLEGEIESYLEDMMVDMLNDEVPAQIEEFLNTLPFEFTFEVLGIPLTVTMGPDDVEPNNFGITAWLKGDITSEMGHNDCVPLLDGSYRTDDASPNLRGVIPGTNISYDVAIVLSDDFINRILFKTFDFGLICYELSPEDMMELGLPAPLTTELFAGAVPRIHDYCYNEPMYIVVRPQEPPIIYLDNTEEEPYPITLTMNNLMLDFYANIFDRWFRLFTFNVTVEYVKMSMEVTIENAIHIELSDDVSITTEVVYDELLHLTPEERAAVENLLPTLVNLILPLLSDSISDIPLPEIEGFIYQVLDLRTIGDNYNFVGIFANLIPVTDSDYQTYQISKKYLHSISKVE